MILRRLRERAVVRQAGPISTTWIRKAGTQSAACDAAPPASWSPFALRSSLRSCSARGGRRAQEQPRAGCRRSFLANGTRRDSPGCALGVFRNGKIVYERGYGMADLENDMPITPASVFYVGSLSKQFTAMAAALAIQQAAASAADDPIRKWLPGAACIWRRDHRPAPRSPHSGLRDYNTLLVDCRPARRRSVRQPDGAADDGPAEGAQLRARHRIPLLEHRLHPARHVVERATKTPFAAYADAKIFKPLGMPRRTSTPMPDGS